MAEMPTFVGTVNERGQLDFAPAVRGLMRAHLLRLKPGVPVEVTLKRWRNKRSSRANRYCFGVVYVDRCIVFGAELGIEIPPPTVQAA